MSILIKGMEMPKTCGECRFSVDGWCYAIASDDDQPGYIKPYEKAKWCPLVPVPPHGRLIDADALKSYMEECKGENAMDIYATGYARSFIDNAQTVIPADKDGEI